MSPTSPAEIIAQEIAKESARTRLVVEALGEAIRAAHVTASPALARSAQAAQNLYSRIESEFGLLSSAEAGARMGSRSIAARNLALTARRDRRILGFQRGRYQVFPGFQFDERGLRPVVADLISLGDAHDRSETGLIQWLMSPTTYLQNQRPVDILDQPDELLKTAATSFGVEW